MFRLIYCVRLLDVVRFIIGKKERGQMQCGAKCFIVEIELDGEKKRIPVKARTSVLARKTVRVQYEDAVKIISVREEK